MTCAQALALLLAAGWTPAPRLGWWRDPASGREYREWRALEIARRDAGEVRT